MSSTRGSAYRKFARRLRLAREQAGFTQQEVAAEFQQHQSWLSKCESGERRVDTVELNKFARLYGLPIAWFFEDDPVAVHNDSE